MCGNIENRKKGEEGEESPLHEGKTNEEEKSVEEVIITAPQVLKISIFFDGTGNNRFNTEVGYTPLVLKESYTNYYSNVALLYLAMEETEWHKKIYIQGAGTSKYQSDMLFGLGFAVGTSGIILRVHEAKRAVEKWLRKTDQNRVTLRLYGFSRGAAYARYFCSYIKKQHPITKETDARALLRAGISGVTFGIGSLPRLTKPEVYISFLGLFDTVSSILSNPYDDVQKYDLDTNEKEHGVSYIVHLTAQDDFRGKFPLTRIKAAVNEGTGFECSFPGAHSDIGGGYPAETKDEELYLGYKEEEYQHAHWVYWKWFKKKGYYKDDDDNPQLKYRHEGLPFYEKVYGSRTVTFHYQFILAEIMQDIMREKRTSFAGRSILKKDIHNMKKIPVLEEFRNLVHPYVLNNYKTPGAGYSVPLLRDRDLMKEIYNKYIHNSLDFSRVPISDGGTTLNKETKADGSPDFLKPTRPIVTEGYKK